MGGPVSVRLVEIRQGLRKLEFAAASTNKHRPRVDEAVVEFVRDAPLRSHDHIRVELGVKEGLMRELIGRPTLINTVEVNEGSVEYHYRLQAPIVATAQSQNV
jgi:hypothetical protein